jgi:hypothetical protein
MDLNLILTGMLIAYHRMSLVIGVLGNDENYVDLVLLVSSRRFCPGDHCKGIHISTKLHKVVK